jgi:hypothetical protein
VASSEWAKAKGAQNQRKLTFDRVRAIKEATDRCVGSQRLDGVADLAGWAGKRGLKTLISQLVPCLGCLPVPGLLPGLSRP